MEKTKHYLTSKAFWGSIGAIVVPVLALVLKPIAPNAGDVLTQITQQVPEAATAVFGIVALVGTLLRDSKLGSKSSAAPAPAPPQG